jgi:hypothetical protein
VAVEGKAKPVRRVRRVLLAVEAVVLAIPVQQALPEKLVLLVLETLVQQVQQALPEKLVQQGQLAEDRV